MILSIQHSSLQFSDNKRQKAHDVKKIFTLGNNLMSGTEAGRGGGPLNRLLKKHGKASGYRVKVLMRTGCWVAVDKKNIVKGSVKTGYVPMFEGGKDASGRWADRGIVWIQFEHRQLGIITMAGAHFFTHGKLRIQPRWYRNRRYAQALAKWMKARARGDRLAFVGLDGNMDDKTSDLFFGASVTTCWDELKKWPNTTDDGVTIDAIASCDKDKRVRCVSAESLNDREFFLHADHRTIVAKYEVTPV